MAAPETMTDDEVIAWLNARGNGDPDENGIPLDQLRENRRYTPADRLDRAERAAAGMLSMRRAGEAHRARRRST